MVPLQNRRVIVYFFLLFFIVACKSLDTDPNYKKIKAIISEKEANKYDNFLIVSPILCKGCVQDKFIEYFEDADEALIARTAIIMDTSEHYFAMPDTRNAKILHIQSSIINKTFPRIANVCVFKKDRENNKMTQKVVNADDSSIMYYLQ